MQNYKYIRVVQNNKKYMLGTLLPVRGVGDGIVSEVGRWVMLGTSRPLASSRCLGDYPPPLLPPWRCGAELLLQQPLLPQGAAVPRQQGLGSRAE